MKQDEIKELWGEDLFNVFAEHIDEDGWLTDDWADIIENEVPKFDEDYNSNPVFERTYQRMYWLDMERNTDDTKLRPLPNQN